MESRFQKLRLTLGLVFAWLTQHLRTAGHAVARRLRAALPTQAELEQLRRSTATAIRTIRGKLSDPATYTTARTAITNAYHHTIAVLGNRDMYLRAGRRIAGAARTTIAVLGNRETYRTAYRNIRTAVTNPGATWRALSDRVSGGFTNASDSGMLTVAWRGAAALGIAAVLSITVIGGNAANQGSATSSAVTLADAPATDVDDRGDHANRSNDRDEQPRPEAQDAEQRPTPKPVAGLDSTQMANAVTVVQTGQDMGISKRGQAVALVTAMQETKFHNYASSVLPESQKYPFDKIGSDHDSVGIFQQRPSMGWGSVGECMDPAYASKAFYKSLKAVHGWEDMPLTVAAQTVQGSAFPDAYAQWEPIANAVLDEVG